MKIFKRGKSWYLDYRYKGKRYRKSVGRSKRVAELALKDIELRIAKKEHLGIEDDRKILYRDFAREYRQYSKTNKTRETHRRDKSLIRNLLEVFGDFYLYEITEKMVEEYKSKRLNSVSPASTNRSLSCLKHMFRKAIDWGYLREAQNPTRNVKLLKEPPGRLRYLSMDEIGRLIKACSEELRPIVIMALNTGMRKGEILNLKWEDVDLKRNEITLEKTKNNDRSIISMNDFLVDVVKRIPRKSTYLFPYKNNGVPLKNVRKSFATALKKANIKSFVFHDLRHTFASLLIEKRYNLKTVQELMRHKSIHSTLRYLHLSRAHLDGALQDVGTKMAQLDEGASKPPPPP